MFFGGHMDAFLLGKHLGVELLGHRVYMYVSTLIVTTGFPKWLYQFT